MSIESHVLDNWFTHHPITEELRMNYGNLRTAARLFAIAIVSNTPEGADQTAALRKVREALMTANAAIACGEK